MHCIQVAGLFANNNLEVWFRFSFLSGWNEDTEERGLSLYIFIYVSYYALQYMCWVIYLFILISQQYFGQGELSINNYNNYFIISYTPLLFYLHIYMSNI